MTRERTWLKYTESVSVIGCVSIGGATIEEEIPNTTKVVPFSTLCPPY